MDVEREEVERLVALFAAHGVAAHVEDAQTWGMKIVTLTGPDMTRTSTTVDVPQQLRSLAQHFGIDLPPDGPADALPSVDEMKQRRRRRGRTRRVGARPLTNPRVWKLQVPGIFGPDDLTFGTKPPDRVRARQLLIDAWAAGATWEELLEEAAKYLRRQGATQSHINAQLERMRQVQHWRG